MIYVIGDSHSRSFSYNENFFPIFLGEGKLHNFINDDNSTRVEEKVTSCLRTIERNAKVILFFAEPDARYFLGKGWKPWTSEESFDLDTSTEIDASVSRYIKTVQSLSKKFPEVQFAVMFNIPSERVEQTHIASEYNKQLKAKISELGDVQYIDVFDELIVHDPVRVNPEYQSDQVHLNHFLQKFTESVLVEWAWIGHGKFNDETEWNNHETKSNYKVDSRFGCYIFQEDPKATDTDSFIAKETLENIDIENLLKTIKDYGLIVFPETIAEDELSDLNSIYDRIISGQEASDKLVSKGNDTVDVFVLKNNGDLQSDGLNKVRDIFESERLRDVARGYFGQKDYLYNRDIFIARDLPGSQHEAKDLHFDVRPTLKYFLYLSDTNSENGAFTVVPGSHKQTSEIRKEYGSDISYKNRHLSRPDVPIEKQIAMEFPAGTLIIFTTELFHKAGTVTKGERRVIRSHSWSKNHDSFGNTAESAPNLLRRILNKFTS